MKTHLSLVICTALFMSFTASADTIILDAIDRGWVANDGGSSGSFTGNINYLVGDSGEFRMNNWFIFDLTGIDQPIVSAELQLFNISYFSPDPTETYTIFEVTTSPSVLMSGQGGIPAFNDLGSGTIHGSHIASSADDLSTIMIPLNAAALGSLNGTPGLWATGGAFTTLDNDFGTEENMFAGTGLFPLSSTRLVIHTIPAPAALPLLLAPVLLRSRRRNRNHRRS